MQKKSKVFIGSSKEGIEICEAINYNLDMFSENTLWQHAFDLSSNTLDALFKKTTEVDYAIFIFSADDIAIIRDEKKLIARDNVLFELGLFIGAIGKDRCIIVKPRDIEMHLPTDLLGIVYTDYDSNRTDSDWHSALAAPATKIKQHIIKTGNREYIANPTNISTKPIMVDKNLAEMDKLVLLALLDTYTEKAEGTAAWTIKNELKSQSKLIDLSLIKLDRLNYIDKSISEDYNGSEYYVFKITELGINILLEMDITDTPLEVIMYTDDIPF